MVLSLINVSNKISVINVKRAMEWTRDILNWFRLNPLNISHESPRHSSSVLTRITPPFLSPHACSLSALSVPPYHHTSSRVLSQSDTSARVYLHRLYLGTEMNLRDKLLPFDFNRYTEFLRFLSRNFDFNSIAGSQIIGHRVPEDNTVFTHGGIFGKSNKSAPSHSCICKEAIRQRRMQELMAQHGGGGDP
ncbi:hypothetical protein LXL04_035982 [Taraxacum kok-saghyz]